MYMYTRPIYVLTTMPYFFPTYLLLSISAFCNLLITSFSHSFAYRRRISSEPAHSTSSVPPDPVDCSDPSHSSPSRKHRIRKVDTPRVTGPCLRVLGSNVSRRATLGRTSQSVCRPFHPHSPFRRVLGMRGPNDWIPLHGLAKQMHWHAKVHVLVHPSWRSGNGSDDLWFPELHTLWAFIASRLWGHCVECFSAHTINTSDTLVLCFIGDQLVVVCANQKVRGTAADE